jgi:Arc/MetJ-type ribon-helix-helix transcriptional regulator
MTTQIAVRLDDALVRFMDDEIASGNAPSRAALVTRALERERRRLLAARDAEILARASIDAEELGGAARWQRARSIDLD